ncbi:hypothetical protein [Chitinimonas koreensis]|uniref:hypothetical protein n=1 Tax=Chitinimonas koreensis TaxID=356302 RepID=UPI0012FA051A|nr:hypothetical protein [Chitinimonas koreensis]QNM98792.1 hypothetical protein H9L41_11620 [Chitinimonas koreensis]
MNSNKPAGRNAFVGAASAANRRVCHDHSRLTPLLRIGMARAYPIDPENRP